MNHIDFIRDMIEGPTEEERRWGRELLNSQKFDFGPYGEMPKLNNAEKVFPYIEHCPDAFNLPFDNCLMYASSAVFLHARKNIDEDCIETRICVFNQDDDTYAFNPVVGFIDFQGQRLRCEPFMGQTERDKPGQFEALSFHYCLLASFLAIINSENVEQIDHLPKQPSLNGGGKKCDRRLFVYKTLHIKPATEKGSKNSRSPEGSELSHAESGVRVHLRRGHLRRLPGKIVWVQPAVVGDPKKGAVTKKYRVD